MFSVEEMMRLRKISGAQQEQADVLKKQGIEIGEIAESFLKKKEAPAQEGKMPPEAKAAIVIALKKSTAKKESDYKSIK